MKPPRGFFSRIVPFSLFLAVFAGRAETLVWDFDGGLDGAQDGTGGWAVGAGNFFDETNLLQNRIWSDGADAVFGAATNAAGAVVLVTPVTVNSLTFRPAGSGTYALSGDTLTLGGTAIVAQVAGSISSVLAGASGLDKSGPGLLTLQGPAANTIGGPTRVRQGGLNLAKPIGPAVGGDVEISAGAFLQFGGSQQIPSSAVVTLHGPGGVLNGNGVNAGQFNTIQQTVDQLVVDGGVFNCGSSGQWTVLGSASFTGGAGNAIYVGNSGGRLDVGSLSLTAMPATAGANVGTVNSFTVYGSSTLRQTLLRIGAGGLQLNGSVLNLRRGATGQLGSRIVLDGDLSTAGTAASGILEDMIGGSNGTRDLELSASTGVVQRVMAVSGGGANLNIGASMTNGTADSVAISKTGAGTLTLSGSGANSFTGGMEVHQGALVLNKTAGQAALGGDLVIRNANLSWAASHQIPDDSSLIFHAGTIQAFTRDETLKDYTQYGGGLTAVGNTGHMTITGTLSLFGGNAVTLNSNPGSANPASWTAGAVALSGADLVVGGGNGAGNPRTRFTVGAGGLSMAGRSITLNRGDAGTLFELGGDFMGAGVNTIAVQQTGVVEPELTLGTARRTFHLFDGTTTIQPAVTGAGAGIHKTGPGALHLMGANTYDGPTLIDQGRVLFARPLSFAGGNTANWTPGLFTVQSGATAAFRVGAAGEFTASDIALLGALGDAGGGFQPGSSLGLDTTGVGATGTFTLALALADPNAGAHSLGLEKLGVGTLVLGGPDGNTHSGPSVVFGGALRLAKTAGLAIPGDLLISNGAFLTFAGNEQIADTASVTMTGAGSVLNGTAVNTSQLQTLRETIAGLDVSGGVFNSGNACDWTITGEARFTGGAGNTQFLGNSGAVLRFHRLHLAAMTAIPGPNVPTANSFALYGNNTTIRSTITVGPGGLHLDGSTFVLRRGGSGARGSRLILAGDVTTSGNLPSAIFEDTSGGGSGAISLDLSDSAAPVVRTFFVEAGGADLTITVPVVDGAAAPGGLTKSGGGILDLTAVNAYTGDTTVLAGVLKLRTASLPPGGDVAISAAGRLELAFLGTNTIAALTLAGVGQLPGTHGASDSGATHVDDDRFAGAGVLLVTQGPTSTPFSLWAAAAGLDGTPGHENGPADDPDEDGMSNLAEFALGGDPLEANDRGTSEIRVEDTLADVDADTELSLTLEVRTGASFAVDGADLTAALDGVRYRISGSLALPGFGATVQELTPPLPGGAASVGYDRRTFRLVSSNGQPGPGYLRVTVTDP